jgi:murein DD-endopeptidase MepM/ murein hydrolase activator NlpD
VLAATAGRIEIDTSQAWAGRWLVKVVTAPTSLATWFAHMQKLDVTAGQVVRPGEQIGEVGDLGNATGCHLHFEIWTAPGWSSGGAPIDPLPTLRSWLSRG